ADGYLYRYDFGAGKLTKLDVRLPAVPGRESWASLDAAVVHARKHDGEEFASVVGGTSDGYLFELRIGGKQKYELRPRGRVFAQGRIQGMVIKSGPKEGAFTVRGVGGGGEGMPRSFTFRQGGASSAVIPSGIPLVDGQLSMVGFGAMIAAPDGTIYAGERDRIGRLVRFSTASKEKEKPAPPQPPPLGKLAEDNPPKLGCRV